MSRPGRALRVGLVRLQNETNGLSTLETEVADFERTHWFEGAALLANLEPKATEAPGFLKNAELSGALRGLREHGRGRIEPVALFSAWAISGGPLSRDALDTWEARLRRAVRAAMPLDGVIFAMHGSMGATGERDPEARLLSALREELGPDAVIGATLDLHATMTPEKMASGALFSAYHTNPHRDHDATGYRAARIVARTLLGQAAPVQAWRSLPMVLGGGTTIDFAPTMRPIFQRVRTIAQQPGVLDASLLMCHLWVDHPELGWATVVQADRDERLAGRLADELADLAWSVRDVPAPEFPSAEEAIARVRASRRLKLLPGTACVCDGSDIVGAGAPGDSTGLLRALWEKAIDLRSYAPVRDAAVIADLWPRAVGDRVEVTVGGRYTPQHAPLAIHGRIASKHADTPFGRVVVLDAGHLQLVITEAAPLVMKPAFYADVGLSPWKADLVVVKSLFPFRLYFLPQNRLTIYAKTGGITDLDTWRFQEFARPVVPKDRVVDWRPADRARRGVHG